MKSVMSPEMTLSAEQLQELYQRPWWACGLQSLVCLASYGGLSVIGFSVDQLWLWPVLWVIQGFILSGFLGASHDCAHGTFLRHPGLNRLAGGFWAGTVLFNYSIYKYYHLEHHQYTSVEGDTEPSGLFDSAWDYFAAMPCQAFFIAFWKMSYQAFRGEFPHFIRTEKQRREVLEDNWIQLLWIGVAVTLTVFFPKEMALCYWGPMIFYFPMVYLTSLPEHYGCAQNEHLAENTRSLKSNAVFRFYFWNGNYHAEHHAYPGVPSWNLPRLSQLIGHAFQNREPSYVAYHLRIIWELITNTAPRPTLEVPAHSATHRVDYETYKTS
jgi:fatty acid desaturase